MDLAIRTEHLTKKFGPNIGIDQVSLRVPCRSIYGFLGPNGAGKTTTIRLLLGLLQPQYGDIEVLGQSLYVHPSILAKVGALIDAPSLYPHLSGLNNLEVTRRLLGLPKSAVDRTLELTGLNRSANRRVGEYSMGMRQRLGIAIALLGTPQLLILDEPSNGLDPAGIADLRHMLKRFSNELNITVLISSHLLGEVQQMATHVGVLHEGKLRFQGSMEELQATNRSQVRILCKRPSEALSWVRANHYDGASEANGWITVPADSHQVPHLMHQMIEANIEVIDITLHESSLEKLFFDLTCENERVVE